ncbi:MAG TPA: MucB/RseB C-terminal domain-containing protein, partial [Casimicrobiaceae bacterium]|nr:MucB/RseB C-terminal domain-containing protein [Casimicrobiaceae bacterium]
LKARMLDSNNGVIEQFVFTDISIGAKVDTSMVKPTWPTPPPDWRVRQWGKGESPTEETGWTVTRLPPGFVKIVDKYRGFQSSRKVAFLVFSDGLVSVSVFVEPGRAAPPPNGFSAQSGLNVYSRQVDDSLVTVLGEVPPLTLRQIANSVTRR